MIAAYVRAAAIVALAALACSGGTLAYPALIQARLDSAGRRFRVVNAGISGESSAGALSRIEGCSPATPWRCWWWRPAPAAGAFRASFQAPPVQPDVVGEVFQILVFRPEHGLRYNML